MIEQWKELKETITELRDNDGKGTQYEVCKFLANLMVVLEKQMQESYEDDYIKVPKKALKYRTAGMVAYNAEWLKNHFDIERAVICGAQEFCEDAISRQAALDLIADYDLSMGQVVKGIHALPSVTPQPKTGYISIDDVMSVFDDFMCGEVDEDGTNTFLIMLKDKAESEEL